MESRWIDASGMRMHVRVADAPAATPLVLVHGVIVSSRYMLPLAEELEGELPVYAPDLPGYGLSQRPDRPLDTRELAAALGAAVDALALERPVLLGNSFGCQVVAELAATRPDVAGACVLVAPTYDPGASRLRNVLRWAANAPFERPSLYGVIARDVVDMGARRAAGAAAHSLRHRIELRLPHVRQPTLVITGDRDPAMPLRWGEEAARLLPDGRHVRLPRAPHAINYTAPRELAAVVRAFLAGL